MDDLLEWLRVQLDDDERAARKATLGPWTVGKDGEVETVALTGTPGYETPAPVTLDHEGLLPSVEREDAEHIALHDPARVLREVEAKRERLRFIGQILGEPPRPEHGEYKLIRDGAMMACAFRLMRIEVLPYVDRPGYLDEWLPEPT